MTFEPLCSFSYKFVYSFMISRTFVSKNGIILFQQQEFNKLVELYSFLSHKFSTNKCQELIPMRHQLQPFGTPKTTSCPISAISKG